MKRESGRMKLGLVVTAATVLGLILVLDGAESGAAQQRSVFMGGNPSRVDSEEVNLSRLRFPAGSRSNWHTHTDGQLLMLEDGRGLTQVRGEPIYEMHPGEPWWTDADVEHWHGAHPDEAALQLTIYAGTVEWLEPVTDEQYTARAMRR